MMVFSPNMTSIKGDTTSNIGILMLILEITQKNYFDIISLGILSTKKAHCLWQCAFLSSI